MAVNPSRIRWDRLGRVALLVVGALVLALYIGPARAWVTTYHASKERKAQLTALERENARLTARRDALRRPATLEAEARSLGMVRGTEKAYVITGLPKP